MALVDVLKQVVLAMVHTMYMCPDVCGLTAELERCKSDDDDDEACCECWTAAIARAEKEEEGDTDGAD